MSSYKQARQQASKAAILHGVYRDNLGSGKLPYPEQQPRSRARRGISMGVLAVLLILTGFLVHTVFRDADNFVSSVEIQKAKYVAGDQNKGLPPLITEANAGVIPVKEGKLTGFVSPRSGFFSGKGAVLPPADKKAGKSETVVGPVFGAGDYQALFDQPEVAIADLFGLGVRTIVIDAGHGGEDPGAIGTNGLMEKDITLKIARLLYNRLVDEEGINVIMTRDSDVTLSLKHRVEYAREHDADLLVSIHLNTIPNSPLTIVETYYFGPPADDQSMKVAKKENYHSGYAVAEFNELINELGDALKQQESRKLASHIQKSVYNTLSRQNSSIVNAGVKTAPFVILLGAETPAVLAEVTCISNTGEEARLAKPAYRDKIAGALERGILSYLNQLRQQDRQRPEQGSNIYAES